MKKLILIVLLFLGAHAFAQDSTSFAALPDSAKVTFSTVYHDVKDGLKGLAAGLKVGVEHVYGVLTMQQVVKSVTNILVNIALFIVFLFLYRTYKKGVRRINNKDDEWYGDSYDDHVPGVLLPLIASVALALAVGIFFLCTINETVTGFVNPEFGAIKDIFEFINPPHPKH